LPVYEAHTQYRVYVQSSSNILSITFASIIIRFPLLNPNWSTSSTFF